MIYGYLADLMVAIHVAYVGYVVIGQLLILIGLCFGWQWIRNPWFRVTHLLAIGFVAYEELIGMRCPLTVWENDLRALAGQPIGGETFVSRLLRSLIFIEGQPPEFFAALHLGCAAVVIATFILAPPRWPRRLGRVNSPRPC